MKTTRPFGLTPSSGLVTYVGRSWMVAIVPIGVLVEMVPVKQSGQAPVDIMVGEYVN
jgi:hypothetical protein